MIPKSGLAVMLRALIARGVRVGLYSNETPPSGIDEVQEPLPRQPIPDEDWLVDEPSSQMQTRSRYHFLSPGRIGLVYGYFLESENRLVNVQRFAHPVPLMTTEDKIWVQPRIRAREWE